jgi:catechol 2,3-dioxygenase-like lactoylglutathione lyase family enzyme
VIDHVGVNVKSVESSRAFYERALAPLGYGALMTAPEGVGFGRDGKPDFWIGRRDPVHAGVHVAFVAKDRPTVDAFYAAAIAAGGRDNGKPGLRPHYHENYYGAFVLDPDGNNIEAVCHKPA